MVPLMAAPLRGFHLLAFTRSHPRGFLSFWLLRRSRSSSQLCRRNSASLPKARARSSSTLRLWCYRSQPTPPVAGARPSASWFSGPGPLRLALTYLSSSALTFVESGRFNTLWDCTRPLLIRENHARYRGPFTTVDISLRRRLFLRFTATSEVVRAQCASALELSHFNISLWAEHFFPRLKDVDPPVLPIVPCPSAAPAPLGFEGPCPRLESHDGQAPTAAPTAPEVGSLGSGARDPFFIYPRYVIHHCIVFSRSAGNLGTLG